MSSHATAANSQPFVESNPTQLPELLRQASTELADPTVSYLLVGHYYERTNHPRRRHYPAVFAWQQGEVANVEVGPDFVAFDAQLVRYPERDEPHYPGPWTDQFRATIPLAQLYQVCRQVRPAGIPPATRGSARVRTEIPVRAAGPDSGESGMSQKTGVIRHTSVPGRRRPLPRPLSFQIAIPLINVPLSL